jgi:starch phosphorylase
MVDWQHGLEQKWATVHFDDVKVETRGGEHLFEIQVYLSGLDPDTVRVELCADGVSGGEPVRQEMKLKQEPADTSGCYVYRAVVSAARPPADYTARVVPHRDGVAIPLEASRILWQR